MRKLGVWATRLIGALLFFIGIVPLTPLIWLLVLFRVDGPEWFVKHVKLEFWQTQSIGLALAGTGLLILFLTFRKRRRE